MSSLAPTAVHAVRVQRLQRGALSTGARTQQGTGFEAYKPAAHLLMPSLSEQLDGDRRHTVPQWHGPEGTQRILHSPGLGGLSCAVCKCRDLGVLQCAERDRAMRARIAPHAARALPKHLRMDVCAPRALNRAWRMCAEL